MVYLSGPAAGTAPQQTGERHLNLQRWTSAALLSLATACAPTLNLVDPASPKFEGSFARALVLPAAAPSTGKGSAGLELPGNQPIRIVAFNIKLSREIDRAIEVLRSDSLRGADVVALEEMDDTGVERIARALGLNYVYYPGVIHPSDHRYFGPALLTPWPIERSWKMRLPHLGRFRHQQRTATAAVIMVRGVPVRAYAVHLETQLRISDKQRADQVRMILEDAAGAPGPVIVAGDFNSYDIGPVLTGAGYYWATEQVGPTISVFSWDHIFVRGLAPAAPASAGVVREVRGASDHRPVYAVMGPGILPAAEPVTAAATAASPTQAP